VRTKCCGKSVARGSQHLVCGGGRNAGAVCRFLDVEPALVNWPGPHGWLPSICACYSRAKALDPAHDTFEVARVLLDRGADLNAFTIKGNADQRLSQKPRRFTALSSLFGGGSTGCWPISRPIRGVGSWRNCSGSAGPNPADEEALHLTRAPWRQRLARAARTRCACSSPITPGWMKRFRASSPGSMLFERETAKSRLLEEAGAPVAELDPAGRFVSLRMAADERGAVPCSGAIPNCGRAQTPTWLRGQYLPAAEAVKLTLEPGFDPSHIDDNAAIHHVGVLA
jgi:hypothetical protein